MYPSHITIEPEFDIPDIGENRDNALLEFGWEPNGSGLIWHNERSSKLPVCGVEFLYPVLKDPPNIELEDEPRNYDPVPAMLGRPTDGDFGEQLKQIGEQLGLIRQAVFFIAALVAVIAITIAFGR